MIKIIDIRIYNALIVKLTSVNSDNRTKIGNTSDDVAK